MAGAFAKIVKLCKLNAEPKSFQTDLLKHLYPIYKYVYIVCH